MASTFLNSLQGITGAAYKEVQDMFTKDDGNYDWTSIGALAGMGASALGLIPDANAASAGYQGKIPELDAVRERVPSTYDPNRRPGSGGQRYFTDVQYQPKGAAAAPMSAEGLATLNAANPAQQMRKPSPIPVTPLVTPPVQQMAAGGIAQLKQGKYLGGRTDGMADKVPASIDGVQEARLSDGEFVIPADVVSHLGNGNSDAGAKVLGDMLTRVRKKRTGNGKQGKQINPKKFLPA